MIKNYTVTEINRNFLIKVYGVDQEGNKVGYSQQIDPLWII